MLRNAVNLFRKMGGRSKKILGGLVRVGLRFGIREVTEGLPIVGTVTRLVEELAGFGVDRLSDPGADVPDLKAPGDVWDNEQLTAVNQWMGDITDSLKGLHERLDQSLAVRDDDSWEDVAEAVQRRVEERQEMIDELASIQKSLRKQTLSLHRIEQQLSEFFQVQKGVQSSLEDIKDMLVELSPLATEWSSFRQADPEALRLLNEADRLILAGQREEGEKQLLDLLRRRGMGTTVIARCLGLHKLEEGRLDQLPPMLDAAGVVASLPPALTSSIGLTAAHGPRPKGSSWTCLPRGFVVEHKYRIEEEIGRGGMASVYRVAGVDHINKGKEFALKVPAPGLVDDEATVKHFIHEINLSMHLTEAARLVNPRPPILSTYNYVVFEEPHTKRLLYGLVLKLIHGQSLARLLAERRAARHPLTADEIRRFLLPVCQALEFAHSQTPPVLHRDVKSANVMVTADGQALLMDFGIGRLLDNQPSVATKADAVTGTLDIMPPELLRPGPAGLDERVDVYMVGKLLVELMTFDLVGDPTTRRDCPSGWVTLFDDATSHRLDKRPRSMRAFVERLKSGTSVPVVGPAPVPKPPPLPPPPPPPPIQTVPPVPVPKVVPVPPKLVLVVDQRGRGDHRTISDALAAGPVTRIAVRPGHYKEAIVLSRNVEVVGDGKREDIVVENSDGPALTMHTEEAKVRGLTLRCTAGSKGKRCYGVAVPRGKLLLEACDLTSDSLSCLAVYGSSAQPRVVNCKIHDGKQAGILVFDQARGTFEGCDIYANVCAGVEIKSGGDPRIVNCKIHDGKQAGVFVHEQGRGTFEGCDVFANALAGIEVKSGGQPTVTTCKFRDGQQSGIFVWEQGRGTFQVCDVSGNALAGIAVRSGGQPTVSNCNFHNGKHSGIFVREQGKGTFVGCEVFANALAGLEVKTGGEAKVVNCKFHNGKQDGIFVHEQGRAALEGCDVFANVLAGLAVKTGGVVKAVNCKFREGREHGICVEDKGVGTFEGCEVLDNASSGLTVKAGGDVKVVNCKFHRGKQSGIFVHEQAGGIFEDCDVCANVNSGIRVGAGGDVQVRRCRFTRNGWHGVDVHDRGQGTFEECELSDNKKGAWHIEPGCNVVRGDNQE